MNDFKGTRPGSMRLLRWGTALALAALLVTSLSACFPLVMGGAFTSAMVATDRRTTGTVVEDNSIQLKAGSRITDNLGDRVHVNVNAYNRQVLLTGEVPTLQDKQLVEKVVSGVDNVRSVINELAVLGHSTLSQRSSDVLVATRIKASLVDTKNLVANAFKVVVERGAVYVFGRVTAHEAALATDVIRKVDGVQRVVILWEIISDDELARMLPAPAPAASSPSVGNAAH